MCKKNKQTNQLLIPPLKMFLELCLRVTWYSLSNYFFNPSIFPSSTWCEFYNDTPFGCNTLLPSYFYTVFAALLSLSTNRNPPVAWWRWLLQHLFKHGSHFTLLFLQCCRSSPLGFLIEASRNFNDSCWSRFLWKRGSLCCFFLFFGQFAYSFSFHTDREKVTRL